MTVPKKSRKSADGNRATKDCPAPKPVRKSRRIATKKGAKGAARPGTKQANLITLLKRPAGATVEQMCAKTGWQAHSVRAALTGLRKRGFGISRETSRVGTTVHRIVLQREGSSS